MSKILDMRTSIYTLLVAQHPRVYYQIASDDATFPYIVFDFPNSTDDGTLEQFVMDVDGWDAPEGGDDTALETLMSAIDGALHRASIPASTMSMKVYRENRLPLHDDDKRIRRRKYVYQIRTFGG